jgi:hypothetical protein
MPKTGPVDMLRITSCRLCCSFTASMKKRSAAGMVCRPSRGQEIASSRCAFLGRCVSGCVVSFQITVLKVLAGHPEGRASIADLTRYVSILISSGTDWTNRTRRLAARAPKLDIFADCLVLRDVNGWQITEGGRQFLGSLEAPLPIGAEPVQAPEANMSNQLRSPALPKLRLVVNNDKQPPDGRQKGPSRRSA